MLFTQF